MQVGVVGVAVPSHYELMLSNYSSPEPGTNQTVSVELRGPDDARCNVSSTYLALPAGTDNTITVDESLTNDGKAYLWKRTADGTTWQADATSSDRLTIHCADAAVAKTLARSASFVSPW